MIIFRAAENEPKQVPAETKGKRSRNLPEEKRVRPSCEPILFEVFFFALLFCF